MIDKSLQRALTVLSYPDRASFEAERRLRLFELVRWTVLGGSYEKRQPSSALIYVAAELARPHDRPISGLRRSAFNPDMSDLLQEALPPGGFYQLLSSNDAGIARPLDAGVLQNLFDIANLAENMLIIRAEHGRLTDDQAYVLAENVPGMSRETKLKQTLGLYNEQIAFVHALSKTPEGYAPFQRENGLLKPAILISALSERLEEARLTPFLQHTKTVMEIVTPALAGELRSSWPDLQTAPLDALRLRSTTRVRT